MPLIGRKSHGSRSWGPWCRADSRCRFGQRWRGGSEGRRCLDPFPVRLRDRVEMPLAHLGHQLRRPLHRVGLDLRLHRLEAPLDLRLHMLAGDRLKTALHLLLHLLWGDGHQLRRPLPMRAGLLLLQLLWRAGLRLLLLLLPLLLLLLELHLLLSIHGTMESEYRKRKTYSTDPRNLRNRASRQRVETTDAKHSK